MSWRTCASRLLESKTRVSARQVAKLLVDKGMLTSATAQQLLESGAKPPEKPAPADTAGQTAAAAQPSGKKAGPASPPAASAKGQPAKPPVQKPSPLAGPSADSGMASLLEEELSSLSDGMSSLGGGPLDALLSDPSLAEAVQESNPLDAPVAAKRRAAKPSALWGSRRARKRLLVWISGAAAGILAIVAIVVWLATRQDPTKVPRAGRYRLSSRGLGRRRQTIRCIPGSISQAPCLWPYAGPPWSCPSAAYTERDGGRFDHLGNRKSRPARNQSRSGIR